MAIAALHRLPGHARLALPRLEFPLAPGWQSLAGRSRVEIATYQWRTADAIIEADLAELPAPAKLDVRYEELLAQNLTHHAVMHGFSDHVPTRRGSSGAPSSFQRADMAFHTAAMPAGASVLFTRRRSSVSDRREEQLPVYDRLGDVRSLLVGRAKLAITLVKRGHPGDKPEIDRLLILALRDARRLRLPEAQQIAGLVRQLGGNPDAPPLTGCRARCCRPVAKTAASRGTTRHSDPLKTPLFARIQPDGGRGAV